MRLEWERNGSTTTGSAGKNWRASVRQAGLYFIAELSLRHGPGTPAVVVRKSPKLHSTRALAQRWAQRALDAIGREFTSSAAGKGA